MIKRPFIWILCLFMIGIVCNKYICSIFGFIPLVLITCILCFHFYHILKQKYSVDSDVFLLLLPLILCLGYFLPIYYNTNKHLSDRFLSGEVQFQGRVSNVVQKAAFQEIYLSDVVIIKNKTHGFLSQLLLEIITEEPYVIGDKVSGTGELSEFEPATNPGQFDTREYYNAKGICYQIWDGRIQRSVPGSNPVYRWLFCLKKKLGNIYKTILSDEDSQIMQAMVLGDKSELGTELKNLYQKAGISHILAISGLHISMIGLFLFRLLKKAGVHHNLASAVCMLLIYLYGVMTGSGVSTSRAVIMMCLSLSACLVSRSYDTKSAVAVSGFFILLHQPYQLFQCGFQLSFLAVAGVLWFYPVCVEYVTYLFPDYRKDIQLMEKSEYYSIKVLLDRITRIFRNSLLVSCSIQVVTLPVILWHYYEFASLAPVLNLFILPLSSLLMLLAVLVGVSGFFSLTMASFFGGGIHCILFFYRFLCEWFQKIPFQNVITGRPKLVCLVLYGLCLLCFGILVVKKMRKWNVLLVGAGLFLLLVSFPDSEFQVTMLDVGQGDSIYIEDGKKNTYLVDAGSSSVKQVGNYRILPFLKYRGVKKLNYCFLTHLDEDHINGAKELIVLSKEPGALKLENLVLPHINEVDDAYKQMVKLAEHAGIRVLYMGRGQQMISGQLKLTCLHPTYDAKASNAKEVNRNTDSLVLDLSYGAFRMLLTGDVDQPGEQEILSQGKGFAPRYNVLKVAHHGSRYSSCEEWLSQVKPTIAWISCGRKNRYGHPHEELLERLKKNRIIICRTDRQGALILYKKNKKWKFTTFLKSS